MSMLFISDLHLCAERPQINDLFARFLSERAAGTEALYILGDLFEYWIGDDQLEHDPLAQRVADELARLAAGGTRVYFMHGNRDFLLGERFARTAQLTILPDPTPIAIGDQTILLMHGDTLCTGDLAYQQFRRQVRDPRWQAELLARPYAAREALARDLRARSDMEKSLKAEAIMDVDAAAVTDTFRRYRCRHLLHGHTHRPATHQLTVDDEARIRWVLPDWHERWGAIEARDGGLHTLA